MSKLASHSVLVVDDNADAAQALAMALELLQQRVQVAYTGPAALALLEHFEPDLIMLDLSMPGMDGFELATAIRAKPRFRSTRMIALTGLCQDDARRRSRAAGFDEHLLKPLEFDQLVRLLDAIPA
jgi:hypothetical protein